MKGELDKLYKEKAKGYQIRSRAKWVEQGELNKTDRGRDGFGSTGKN